MEPWVADGGRADPNVVFVSGVFEEVDSGQENFESPVCSDHARAEGRATG